MNATKVLILPALLLPLPLLLGSNAPGTRIRFAPSEGLDLKKTFEVKAELALEDMTLGGAAGGMQPEMEMTMVVNYKVVVSDEYVKLGDGAPTKLKRTYDDLASDVSTSMKMEMMGQTRDMDQSMTSESELEGKSVLFQWDAEKSEFKKAFEPAGGEEKVLKGLREDMDLRALLPKGEVEADAEWEIDPKQLVDVFAPGGDLALRPKDGGEGMDMGPSGMENLADMFGDDVEGTAKGKFTGMREVEGVQLAVIAVTLDVKAKTDMTEAVREAMSQGDLPPEVEKMEFESFDIEMEIAVEGELLWNAAAGHFHSLDLSGTTSFKSDQSMKMTVQGREMAIEQSMTFSGTTAFKASVD
jgi:hypothetical protein